MWTKAITVEELKKRKRYVLEYGIQEILLLFHGEEFYAVDRRCPHRQFELDDGEISDEGVLNCPLHQWRFKLDSGDCIVGSEALSTYSVRESEGYVWVDIQYRNALPAQAQEGHPLFKT